MSIAQHTALRRHPAATLSLALLLVACGSFARADAVWTVTAGGKPFERRNLKIEGMNADGLLFRSMSQDRAALPRPMKEIWRIEADDEPALNAAETAFVADKWDDAVAGYQRAMTASRKDWVRQYAALRLMAAAGKSGRFSAAAAAYVAMVQRDPKAAASAKPDVPKNKAELPAAIEAVKTGLDDARLQRPQRVALQAFLVELYVANGQLKEAQAIGAKVADNAPASSDRSDVPAAGAPSRAQVDLKLQLAVASVKQKKYQEAIDAIDSIAASLTDPEQQADALFSIAEARAGLAGNDPAKLKGAALAYMRVVAHFKSEPGTPHVAESLLKAGVVLERAKLLPDALAAYQAVESDYKDTPFAGDAAAGVARVQKAIEEARG